MFSTLRLSTFAAGATLGSSLEIKGDTSLLGRFRRSSRKDVEPAMHSTNLADSPSNATSGPEWMRYVHRDGETRHDGKTMWFNKTTGEITDKDPGAPSQDVTDLKTKDPLGGNFADSRRQFAPVKPPSEPVAEPIQDVKIKKGDDVFQGDKRGQVTNAFRNKAGEVVALNVKWDGQPGVEKIFRNTGLNDLETSPSVRIPEPIEDKESQIFGVKDLVVESSGKLGYIRENGQFGHTRANGQFRGDSYRVQYFDESRRPTQQDYEGAGASLVHRGAIKIRAMTDFQPDEDHTNGQFPLRAGFLYKVVEPEKDYAKGWLKVEALEGLHKGRTGMARKKDFVRRSRVAKSLYDYKPDSTREDYREDEMQLHKDKHYAILQRFEEDGWCMVMSLEGDQSEKGAIGMAPGNYFREIEGITDPN